MALLEEWHKIAYNDKADQGELQRFWQHYFLLEKGVYEKLLANPDEAVEGTVKELADMAGRSVRYNHLEDDVEIVRGDIKEAADIFGAASFDVVTSNPPYMIGQHGLRNPDMPKAIARHEVLCNLEDVVSQASKVLKERGRFYMVHRPFRLAEIMNVLTKYRLEPKRMQLVYPYIDREPNMVLIEALKGGNSRVKVEPPLIVYKEPGVYTENILKIYDMI